MPSSYDRHATTNEPPAFFDEATESLCQTSPTPATATVPSYSTPPPAQLPLPDATTRTARFSPNPAAADSHSGLIRYLSSGLIKGVGPSTARKIVDCFGENTMDVIENSPQKLAAVDGIGPSKIKTIHDSWKKNKGIHSIVAFLQEYDIGISYAIKIWQRYGKESLEVIRNNPYVLFNDIKGIGFISADKIAMRIGLDQNDPLRASAAIEYILQESMSNGSCCCSALTLVTRGADELHIDQDLLTSALLSHLQNEKLIAVDPANARRLQYSEIVDIIAPNAEATPPLIFAAPYYYIERGIARKLLDIRRAPSPILGKIDPEQAITWLHKKHRIMLAQRQQEGIAAALNHKCCVITGGPGTGKTTMLYSLLLILREMHGQDHLKIKLVAPTGRAAKRLSESTEMTALTIHRLLEFDPIQNAFRYNETNRLNCDFLILDESSMIDAKIMHALLKALPLDTHLVIVGDVDQLPSVGPGAILHDIIRAQAFPIIHLNQIFRQAAESDIVRCAHLINNGNSPKIYAPGARNESGKLHDCTFIDIKSDQNIVEKIISFIRTDITELAKEALPPNDKLDLLRDLQVLSPMQKGPVGVRNLNFMLQRIFNRNLALEKHVDRFGIRYHVADKVMQTENNYNKHVFNGDIGFISSIDYTKQEVIVNFDHRPIPYRFSELEQLVHAYAITIHKSQGSEYPFIIIPIVTQHFVMLNRRLFYTALTRARYLAVFVGQRRALSIAVQNKNEHDRQTILATLLQVMD